MKYLGLAASVIVLTSALLCPSFASAARDVTYQHSTIQALNNGLYEGTVALSVLKKHGDTGIGTYTGMDGEMICLQGIFYRVGSDGKVSKMPLSSKSPFAIMTFFDPDNKVPARKIEGITNLQRYLDCLLPSKNSMFLVKITGSFDNLKTRSVFAQIKPYPPLSKVIEGQSVFDLNCQKGTIIGFFFPEYMKKFNSPGWHFHFLNDKRTAGGHVLDLIIDNAVIEFDISKHYYVDFPESKEYDKAYLDKETENVLTKPSK